MAMIRKYRRIQLNVRLPPTIKAIKTAPFRSGLQRILCRKAFGPRSFIPISCLRIPGHPLKRPSTL